MVHIQDVFKDSQSLKEVIRPADEHGQVLGDGRMVKRGTEEYMIKIRNSDSVLC